MSLLSQQARAIFADTMREVEVQRILEHHVHCDGKSLTLNGNTIPLNELDAILIVAIGKAAVAMHHVVNNVLRDAKRLRISSVVVAPNPPERGIVNGICITGAHPIPDERSLIAANSVLTLLKTTTPRTAVVFLISGGASAMLERPLDPNISMADMACFNRTLLSSGLPIAQINTLRKHASAVKGGRLAETASVARVQCTLLISDVPAIKVDAIGSGPTLPDSSTLAECHFLFSSLERAYVLPPSVTSFFHGPLCVETPKPIDAIFDRAYWSVVLSSDHLAQAAARAARAAGFHVEIDNTCDEWEYREAGHYLLDRCVALSQKHKRSCLLSVGEIGVATSELAGEGGRNQQFALWCATELVRRGMTACVLSAGSDGVDGSSDVAGAVCGETTLADAERIGMSVEDALIHFNSSPVLRAVKADITTGPTGNNLRDLRLLLTESP
jgi:glycerate 2-kinase